MQRVAGLVLAVCLLPAVIEAQFAVNDYSELYEQTKGAVVQVTTDDGFGSGFLVTSSGHIATNYHVIRHSRYIAVQFPGGRKVKAAVVAVNPNYDMAILKVNSEVVTDIQPLKVLPTEKNASVKVGVPVVAIGSPLNQKFLMTQGILSKVDDTTVLGDFLLQAGNSGGPLLNREAEVIGINTFGESNIGGAIRIDVLRVFLETPELLSQSMDVEPSGAQLLSISPVRYPVEILNQKVEHEGLEMDAYQVKAGDFLVTAITPVFIGKIRAMHERKRAMNREERRGKQIADPAYHGLEDRYYEWHRSTETALDYAITFDIRPESGPTKSSRARKFMPPFFIFGKGGKHEVEFKGEFLEFRMYRDGELIEPVMPGRSIVEGNADEKKGAFVDQAYAGSYVYSPDVFLTGTEYRMQIIDARNPEQVHKEIVFTPDSKLIRQLRSDFTIPPTMFVSMTR